MDFLSKGLPAIFPDHDLIKDLKIPEIKSFPEILQEAQQHEYADKFYEHLIEYIKEFDDQLDQEYEVGVRLVSFGQSIQFAVREIGYCNPKLICFYGELEDGSQVQLIQHVNQISFLLLAVKRKNPAQPKRPIGFHWDAKTTAEAETACNQSDEED